MAILWSSVFLLATSISSLMETTLAQQNSTQQNSTADCTGTGDFGPNGDTYNASASCQVPGFYPSGTGPSPPTNWTYNTAVIFDSSGMSHQTIWIDTPDGTDVGSKDLPYDGCITAFHPLPRSTVQRGQEDNGDCMRTFDEDCVRDTVEMAKQQAASFDDRVSSASSICSSLVTGGLADLCKKYTDSHAGMEGAGADGFGNSTSSNSTASRECPETKGANQGFFSWGEVYSEANYDRAVTGVVPVLTLAWAKQRNSTIDPAWTDARLVCMRPSQVSAGSRVPKGVPQKSLGGENGDRKHSMASRFGGRLWARLDPLMVLALCFQSTRPYSSHVKFYQAISLMNSNCSCFAKSPPATA